MRTLTYGDVHVAAEALASHTARRLLRRGDGRRGDRLRLHGDPLPRDDRHPLRGVDPAAAGLEREPKVDARAHDERRRLRHRRQPPRARAARRPGLSGLRLLRAGHARGGR